METRLHFAATTAATRALRRVAAVAFVVLVAGACSGGATAVAEPAETPVLTGPRAENARLARRIAELEVAIDDVARARRRPLDQPVVRSWIEPSRPGDDAIPALELCVRFLAHGDFLDVLPSTLSVTCHQFVVPAPVGSADAVRAFLDSAEFQCWLKASPDRPLPACLRR